MAPEAAKQVVPAIIVIIADAHAGLPAGTRKARLFGDVSESSIAIISVEMRSRRFSFSPLRVEARAVSEIDIEPSVLIVIEKGQAATFGFDDVAFVVEAAPHIGSI